MPKYEGTEKKLEDAFKAAATDAITKDPSNDEKWFEVKISAKVTKNPGIKEYKVEISRP